MSIPRSLSCAILIASAASVVVGLEKGASVSAGASHHLHAHRLDPPPRTIVDAADPTTTENYTKVAGTTRHHHHFQDLATDSDVFDTHEISLWAGVYHSANTSTDGPRTGAGAATINGPLEVVPLPDGRKFITDFNSRTIRMVSADETTVTTVAGDGTSNYVDGPGLSASFQAIVGMAFHPGQHLIYMMDQSCVRTMTPDPPYAVTTIAGSCSAYGGTDSTGLAARFDPSGPLTFDYNYTYLIIATTAHKVRRLNVFSLAATTIMGNGAPGYINNLVGTAGRFNTPVASALTPGGDIIILDRNNFKIRIALRETLSLLQAVCQGISVGNQEGRVDNVACYPLYAAAAMSNVWNTTIIFFTSGFYLKKAENGLVRILNRFASGADNSHIRGLKVDGWTPRPRDEVYKQTLYLSETSNNVIRKVTFSKPHRNYRRRATKYTHAAYAGSGSAGDNTNFATSSPSLRTLNGITPFRSPMHIVSSGYCLRVLSYGYMNAFVGPATGCDLPGVSFNQMPSSLVYREKSGTVLVSISGNHSVFAVYLTSPIPQMVRLVSNGAGSPGFSDTGGAAHLGSRLNGPWGMLLYRNEDRLLIADADNCAIRYYDFPSNGLLTVAGAGPPTPNCGWLDDATSGIAALLNAPYQIVKFVEETSVLISETSGRRIRLMELTTDNFGVTTFAFDGTAPSSSAQVLGPMASAKAGNVYGLAVHPASTPAFPIVFVSSANGYYALTAIFNSYVIALSGGSGASVIGDNSAGQYNGYLAQMHIQSPEFAVIAETNGNRVRALFMTYGTYTTSMSLTLSSSVTPTKTRALRNTRTPTPSVRITSTKSVQPTRSATIVVRRAKVGRTRTVSALVSRTPTATHAPSPTLSLAPRNGATLIAAATQALCPSSSNASLYTPLLISPCCAVELVVVSRLTASTTSFASCNTTLGACLLAADPSVRYSVESQAFVQGAGTTNGGADSTFCTSAASACFTDYHGCVATSAVDDGAVLFNKTSKCAWVPRMQTMLRRTANDLDDGIAWEKTSGFSECTLGLARQLNDLSQCGVFTNTTDQVVKQCARSSSTMTAALAAAASQAHSAASSGSTTTTVDTIDAVEDTSFHMVVVPQRASCRRSYCSGSAAAGCQCRSGFTNRSIGIVHGSRLDAAAQFDDCMRSAFHLVACSHPSKPQSLTMNVQPSSTTSTSRRRFQTLDDSLKQAQVPCTNNTVPFTVPLVVVAEDTKEEELRNVTLCFPADAGFVYLVLSRVTDRQGAQQDFCYPDNTTCNCPDGASMSTASVVSFNVSTAPNYVLVTSTLILCNARASPRSATTLAAIGAGATTVVASVIGGSTGGILQSAMVVYNAPCPPQFGTRASSAQTPGDYINSPVQIGVSPFERLLGHVAVHAAVVVLSVALFLFYYVKYRGDGKNKVPMAYLEARLSSSLYTARPPRPSSDAIAASGAAASSRVLGVSQIFIHTDVHDDDGGGVGDQEMDSVSSTDDDLRDSNESDTLKHRKDRSKFHRPQEHARRRPAAAADRESPQLGTLDQIDLAGADDGLAATTAAAGGGSLSVAHVAGTSHLLGASCDIALNEDNDDDATGHTVDEDDVEVVDRDDTDMMTPVGSERTADTAPAVGTATHRRPHQPRIRRKAPVVAPPAVAPAVTRLEGSTQDDPPTQHRSPPAAVSPAAEPVALSISQSMSMSPRHVAERLREAELRGAWLAAPDCSVFELALWSARAPNLGIKVFVLFFQGVATEGIHLLFSGYVGDFKDMILVGVLVLALQIAFVAKMQVFAVRNRSLIGDLRKEYRLDVYPGASNPHGLVYRFAQKVLPSYYWPDDLVVCRLAGDVFNTYDLAWFYKAIWLRFLFAIIVAVVTKLPLRSAQDCRVAFVLLGVLYIFLALFYIFARPYRCLSDSFVVAAVTFISGMLSISRAFPGAMNAELCLAVLIGLAVASCFWSIAQVVLEHRMRQEQVALGQAPLGTSAERHKANGSHERVYAEHQV